VLPSGQDLEPDQLPISKLNLGLEDGKELVFLKGPKDVGPMDSHGVSLRRTVKLINLIAILCPLFTFY
jgi:hypothetical protein